ncbi:C40 family peptidase [Psychromicrobium xiongbiense]|uniref:C40 family peptidase n=1 Tax=Psychromicrobium xiongbiense TaxID=3051184 RepID=UPI0025578FB8|nr:C40 family peptidase [Psychromicrobium sp. YIM S02556]
MSSTTLNARHRAAGSAASPLTAISKAVASNAGSFGRQAAVVVAAAGLAASVGIPAAVAAPADLPVGTVAAVDTGAQASAQIIVPSSAQVAFEQVQVSSAAPVVQKVAAAAQQVTPTVAKPAATKAPEAPAAPVAGGKLGAVAAAAYGGIGVPYVWGGTTKAGWDCSGFVQWAFAQAGISIPRTNQWSVMVQTSNPQPGDLVVQNGGSHVGVYVGNGMEVNALNPSQGTQLTSVAAVGSAVFYTLP